MEDGILLITIPVRTDIDPALLLEIAITVAADIEDAIESYGGEGHVNPEEISVEDDDKLFGGE